MARLTFNTMRPIALIATLIFTLASLSLSGREWKSAAGDKSFEATYVSNDGEKITLLKGKDTITFSIDKLHADDQAWLKKNHPPKGTGKTSTAPPPKGAAFDTLVFGDTNKEVTEKLVASQMVESTVAEVMLNRIGLNGTFRTKQKIGGLHCHLYFDWDEKMKLKEITLRTKGKPLSSYGGILKSNWKELINLLTLLHGGCVQAAPYPASDDLKDGLILGSHLWHTDNGHSILLGTAQDREEYSVIVQITREHIKANPIN